MNENTQKTTNLSVEEIVRVFDRYLEDHGYNYTINSISFLVGGFHHGQITYEK